MIRELLKSAFNDGSSAQSLATIAEHLCFSDHAKRARPLLCVYFHWLFNNELSPDLVKVAVAAEFIHAASLLHDDVVDNATMRRGKASANAVFGNAEAVLAGDFLLTEAFELLKFFPRELTTQAIVVVKEMTKAAFIEINARGKMELSIEEWNLMAKGKTGVLFSWCGYAAAMLAGKEPDKDRLWAAGEYIGQIFQMADDLKDFSGDQNLKNACQDIRNKEPSLPVILAAHRDPKIMKEFQTLYSKDILTDGDIYHLKNLVFKSGTIDEMHERLRHQEKSLRALIAPYQGTLGQEKLETWVKALCA